MITAPAPDLLRRDVRRLYVVNLAAFTAPIIATGVLLPLFGITASIFIGAAARVVGWVAVLLLVRKPLPA